MSLQTLQDLFNKGPVFYRVTSHQKISPQLKMILKNNPDYEVSYFKKVKPSIKSMSAMFGLDVNPKLRGCGWTRKQKNTSKKARKTSYQSRKRNRQ